MSGAGGGGGGSGKQKCTFINGVDKVIGPARTMKRF